MEKRSRRRIRDLAATASQGLSQNEIGCARISMVARSKTTPFKGRIHKRKTYRLQIITSGLQRTAIADPHAGAFALSTFFHFLLAGFIFTCLSTNKSEPSSLGRLSVQ
jgi:hypothetical protein